jgi:osmoprotectant transport system permease protein
VSWDRFESLLPQLPVYFASHVLLSIGALALGVASSLPLAALAIRNPRIAGPLLGVAGIIQTIPGLALLALMVPLLGRIGVAPALLALVLYSMLPVLRNAVTGALEVDANVLEAARGIGMTDGQILLRVQLPLGAPVLVAGIRTAAVWTVGMATLSTPVGATSLGNLIFSGLQTQNTAAVLLGCAGAALLAIALDGLIRLAEVATQRRDGRLGALCAGLLTLLVAISLVPLWPMRQSGAATPPVIVGAKTFTEQYILATLIADRLREAGLSAEVRDGLGSTVAFEALASGEIDVYVDYAGTIWANHMKRADILPAPRVLAEMNRWLQRERGIVSLGALGFENAYAIAMRRDRARSLGIQSLADLARASPSLSIGGDYEFFARPEWIAVRDRYGLDFAEQRSFDSSLMYAAVVDGHVDAISAFSSDGRIAAYDLVVVEDPLQAFPPYDAVLLLSERAAGRADVVAALSPLVGGVGDQAMRRANKLVDLDGRPIADAASMLDAELRR